MATDSIAATAVQATNCALQLVFDLKCIFRMSERTLPGLRNAHKSGVVHTPDDLGSSLSTWRYSFPGNVRQLKRSVSELVSVLDSLSDEDRKAVLRLMLADHESTGFGRFDPVAWRVYLAYRIAEHVLLFLRSLDVPGLRDADVPPKKTLGPELVAELDIAIAATETKLKTPDDVIAERKTAIWATEGVIKTLVSESDLDALRHQLQRDGSVLAVAEETQPADRAAAKAAGRAGDVVPAGSPDQPAAGGESKPKKTKRSTENGEAPPKIIAALTAYHEYDNGKVFNVAPVVLRELVRLSDTSNGSVSAFFNKEFSGHGKYKIMCRRDRTGLERKLRGFNGDWQDDILYGDSPPGEDNFDDDDF